MARLSLRIRRLAVAALSLATTANAQSAFPACSTGGTYTDSNGQTYSITCPADSNSRNVGNVGSYTFDGCVNYCDSLVDCGVVVWAPSASPASSTTTGLCYAKVPFSTLYGYSITTGNNYVAERVAGAASSSSSPSSNPATSTPTATVTGTYNYNPTCTSGISPAGGNSGTIVDSYGATYNILCGQDHVPSNYWYSGGTNGQGIDACMRGCDRSSNCAAFYFAGTLSGTTSGAGSGYCYYRNASAQASGTYQADTPNVYGNPTDAATTYSHYAAGVQVTGSPQLPCPRYNGQRFTDASSNVYSISCGYNANAASLAATTVTDMRACMTGCAANPSCSGFNYQYGGPYGAAVPEPGSTVNQGIANGRCTYQPSAAATAFSANPTVNYAVLVQRAGSTSSPSSSPSSSSATRTSTANLQTTATSVAGGTAIPTCPASQGATYIDSTGQSYTITCSADSDSRDVTGSGTSTTFDGCTTLCDQNAACGLVVWTGTGSGTGLCYPKVPISNDPSNYHILSGYYQVAQKVSGGATPVSSSASSSSSSSSSSSASSSSSSLSSLAQSSTTAISTATAVPTGVSCPASNGTQYTDSNGQAYTIYCQRYSNSAGIATTYPTTDVTFDQCIIACDNTVRCGIAQWVTTAVGATTGTCQLKRALVNTQGSSIQATSQQTHLAVRVNGEVGSATSATSATSTTSGALPSSSVLSSSSSTAPTSTRSSTSSSTANTSSSGTSASNSSPSSTPNPAFVPPILAPGVNTSSGCGKALPDNLVAGGSTAGPFTFSTRDGLGRSYTIHIPQYYDINRASPLIFGFPGNGATYTDIETQTGMSAASVNPYGIMVYVQGYQKGFESNPGYGPTYNARYPNVDDRGFLNDFIDYLTGAFCVDTGRIWAVGHSNGGGFVNVISCDPSLSTRITAFAGSSAAMYSNLTVGDPNTIDTGTTVEAVCSPSRKIPFIEFHGTADTQIAYNGATDHCSNGCRIIPSIPNWSQRYAVRNGYSSTNVTTVLGTNIIRYQFGSGGDLGIITQYTLGGWIHSYPRISAGAPMDATPVIMQFFYDQTNFSRIASTNPSSSVRTSSSSSTLTSNTASTASSASSTTTVTFTPPTSTTLLVTSVPTTVQITVSRTSSSSLPTATASFCPYIGGSRYTDSNGFAYDVTCNADSDARDIVNGVRAADSLEQCMEICDNLVGCGLVVFTGGSGAGTCYPKVPVQGNPYGYKVTTGTNAVAQRVAGAVVTPVSSTSPSQPAATSSACPYIDGTVYTDGNGQQYQISCAADYQGVSNPIYQAANFEQCMQYCDNTVGCGGVSFTGGYPSGDGSGFCYVKQAGGTVGSASGTNAAVRVAGAVVNPVSYISTSRTASSTSGVSTTPGSSSASSSSATAISSSSTASSAASSTLTLPTATASACPYINNSVYTDRNGQQYSVSCGSDYGGPAVAVVTRASLQACMELCDNTVGCTGISYTGGSGAGACYVKTTGTYGVSSSPGTDAAVRVGGAVVSPISYVGSATSSTSGGASSLGATTSNLPVTSSGASSSSSSLSSVQSSVSSVASSIASSASSASSVAASISSSSSTAPTSTSSGLPGSPSTTGLGPTSSTPSSALSSVTSSIASQSSSVSSAASSVSSSASSASSSASSASSVASSISSSAASVPSLASSVSSSASSASSSASSASSVASSLSSLASSVSSASSASSLASSASSLASSASSSAASVPSLASSISSASSASTSASSSASSAASSASSAILPPGSSTSGTGITTSLPAVSSSSTGSEVSVSSPAVASSSSSVSYTYPPSTVIFSISSTATTPAATTYPAAPACPTDSSQVCPAGSPPGLNRLTCSAGDNAQAYSISCGIEYVGTEVPEAQSALRSSAPSYTDCAASCADSAIACSYFNYVDGECTLLSTATGYTYVPGAIAGQAVPNPPLEAYSTTTSSPVQTLSQETATGLTSSPGSPGSYPPGAGSTSGSETATQLTSSPGLPGSYPPGAGTTSGSTSGSGSIVFTVTPIPSPTASTSPGVYPPGSSSPPVYPSGGSSAPGVSPGTSSPATYPGGTSSPPVYPGGSSPSAPVVSGPSSPPVYPSGGSSVPTVGSGSSSPPVYPGGPSSTPGATPGTSLPSGYPGGQSSPPVYPGGPSSTPGATPGTPLPSGYPGGSNATSTGTAPTSAATIALCPTYDGRNYTDASSTSYSVDCDAAWVGSRLSSPAKRQVVALPGASCLDVCDLEEDCVGVTVLPAGTCEYFSSITGQNYLSGATALQKVIGSGGASTSPAPGNVVTVTQYQCSTQHTTTVFSTVATVTVTPSASRQLGARDL